MKRDDDNDDDDDDNDDDNRSIVRIDVLFLTHSPGWTNERSE